MESIVSAACKATFYQTACQSALLSSTNGAVPQTQADLFDLSVQFSLNQARSARAHVHDLMLLDHKTQMVRGTDDCMELLDDTLDQLTNVANHRKTLSEDPDDVQTWLSAAMTNQATCLASIQTYQTGGHNGLMRPMAQNLTYSISNSLALHMSTRPSKEAQRTNTAGHHRRLLSDRFPGWVTAAERKLLEASVEEIGATAVVAKDGSGTHKTIGEALAMVVTLEGEGRTVIHVKAGTYDEGLKIPTSQKNVMLVGDGKGKTVIVGHKSAAGGSSTYGSATVGVMGDGFIVRDITIVNDAGPGKGQAVALRVGSDRSVVFRCSIIGYQDTLYTLSKRQFYRETDIYGTVDFIFGNSAVVFQSCNLNARKNSNNNFVTAQGREDPNQNTGISIHNCKITTEGSTTYLGRPWKKYSRTVIMQSYLDGSIPPSGWYPWSGSFALSTLFYGEYMNGGPGASTSGRVKWGGYQGELTASEAQEFTVGEFISGNAWLPSTGVSFDSGLIN